MAIFEWITEKTGGILNVTILHPLRLLSGLASFIISFWTSLFWLLAVIIFSIGGIYVIMTALIMVFSINTKDPYKMFSDIGKNLMLFNIFLLQASIELTKIGLRVIAIMVNAIVNLIPFT